MIIFECDNPKCKKVTRARHGYSFVPDCHLSTPQLVKDGKWEKSDDPTYPSETPAREHHYRLVTVQSRLPDGWVWSFWREDKLRNDLLTFCSSSCLDQVLPPEPSASETPEERKERLAKALEQVK